MVTCKFCRNPEIAMTYNQPVDWPACPECVVLVLNVRYTELFTRMLNRHMVRFPRDFTSIGIKTIKAIERNKLAYFMEKRGLLPL